MPKRHRVLFFIGLIFLAFGLVVGAKDYYNNGRNHSVSINNTTSSLFLSSLAFKDGANIPEKYSCKGNNINPALHIGGVPNDAKSLAMIMHDPDAVSGDFTHWVVWDIPTSTANITENSLPPIAQAGSNGAGLTGYTGPCPPKGTGVHHYLFELYALDSRLNLPAEASRGQLESAMQGHILAQSTLTGLFTAD